MTEPDENEVRYAGAVAASLLRMLSRTGATATPWPRCPPPNAPA
ncbi:MAG: hypothetical protein QOI74_2923 [Micromonosporaceae bacterium]|nr:hypothetical protein [Micromonosporaceae bacterium]